MSFYVSIGTFVLLHCDEWDRVVALPRHKFLTGATLLQLLLYSSRKKKLYILNPKTEELTRTLVKHFQNEVGGFLISKFTTLYARYTQLALFVTIFRNKQRYTF